MNSSALRPTAFVLVATNHGSMLVNRHDYRMVEAGGYGVGYQLLNTSSFDQREVDMALRLLAARREGFGEGVMAIDCGANIGVHTIEWAKFMFGWGHVVAFEAQERIYYALAGNITLNNCFNAQAIWAAVGAEAGFIDVPCPDYFTPSSFGSLEIRKKDSTEFIGQEIDYENQTQPVNMVKIDALNLPRLDLLKIDIEGMEIEALQGAEATIERCRPQLLVEQIKCNRAELSAFLNRFGYRYASVGINVLAIHPSDPAVVQLDDFAGGLA